MRQIILDTETTGLDPKQGHRVIELGAVELIDRRFTGKRFHEYINPEREVEAEALAIHGITNEFLTHKPVFKSVVDAFLEFVQGAELIIHNAPFDVGFLNHEFKLAKVSVKRITQVCQVLDTLVLARQLHPGQRNSLDALCKRYHIDNTKRDLHGALLDAEILGHLYLAMTGGQVSLFAETVASHAVAEKITGVNRIVKENLVVLLPTEEEQLAHDTFIQKFKNSETRDWWG